ncbi:MAG: outer membrane lipoprotein carrier protein LolA [Bacteroidales bacterium]|jgi:outer membrane lipoprotein-sorting protein|nr:outer membrane lipoprotein carrier protein LolA [Bacteroidales bacterium]
MIVKSLYFELLKWSRLCLSYVAVVLLSMTVYGQREIKNGVVIDHNAEKIIKNITEKLSADTPISFNFMFKVKQTDKVTQSEKGSFLSNGNKFKIITDNFEDYSDGQTLWHYLKTTNEVEISDASEGGSMFNFSNMITSYLKDYRPKLIREETREKIAYNVLDLSPIKRGNVLKVRIIAVKSTNRISEMIIYTADNVYSYTLSNYKTKQKTSAIDFTFPLKEHPNVQQVDLR